MSKNTIYIIIIIVCLLLAAFIAYKFIFSSSGGGIPDDQMTWVKCNNSACNAEYEIPLNKYHQEVEKRLNPLFPTNTPIACDECNQESIFEACKCQNPNCGIVFLKGISGTNDLDDRCPKCKQSATEESRKERLAERE